MYNLIRTYFATCIYFLLIGCANSIYFYETEKISLTVEARPDSSQPVQGNLGIKQRVALIVPRMNSDNSVGGEALSTISSFNFKITPESGTIFNPVLIQTAFVTGQAAAELYTDPTKTAEVAKAISGISTKLPSLDSYAICISDRIKLDPVKFSKLKEIVNNGNFEGLTDTEWKEYGPDIEKCGVDQLGFDDSLRKELQKVMNK